MSKIPKEIVEKIEIRNALNAEIEQWCEDNLDMDGMSSYCAKITDCHSGNEQHTIDGKEWCDQITLGEDLYTGTYFWETECEGKFLAMDFQV